MKTIGNGLYNPAPWSRFEPFPEQNELKTDFRKSNFKFCEQLKCESIIISSVNNNYEPFPEQNEKDWSPLPKKVKFTWKLLIEFLKNFFIV